MKKIAFIDLGSNSVRFVIIAINEIDNSFKLIHQQKEAIRLSEGLSENNILSPQAMDRALFALRTFSKIAKHMDVYETISVATAAVRLAKNGQAFIKKVYEETGFKLKAITGEDEAKYGYLGVVNTMQFSDFVLFDLGGASIEITLVKNRKIQKIRSFPMGALTLTEKFKPKKELRPQDVLALRKHIQALFAEEDWLKDLSLPLIGIGGTVRNIGKMDQRKRNYPIHKLHNYELSSKAIKDLLEEISTKNLAQRKKVPGLSSERADIIIPGIHIINELLIYTNASSLFVSGCGLREGLFYDYYGKNYLNGKSIRDDVLIDSAENYLATMQLCEFDHVNFVRKLADDLYTQIKPLHKCKERMRKLLDAAAILHDTGKKINYYSHARHSIYIALNAPIYGLSHQEQAICAFIAGFSHGTKSKTPKAFLSSKLLTSADWKRLRKISILLAIAEALDDSYQQSIINIKTKITDDVVTIYIKAKDDYNLGVFSLSAQKIKKQFYKEYKLKLRFEFSLS